MVDLSINRVRAELVVIFALGIFVLALGVWGVYHLLVFELPSGHYSRLPFAAVGCFILGLLMIRLTYRIFIPIKQNSTASSRVCPFCGAMVEEDAAVCGKCKQQLEEKG